MLELAAYFGPAIVDDAGHGLAIEGDATSIFTLSHDGGLVVLDVEHVVRHIVTGVHIDAQANAALTATFAGLGCLRK